MESGQVGATLELARRLADALRGVPASRARLLEVCGRCRDLRVPDHLVGVGMAVWERSEGREGPEELIWRRDIQELLGRSPALEASNIEALRSIGAWLEAQPGRTDRPPVMLGDAAVLHSLYRCWHPFQASLWVVAVEAELPGGDAPATAALGAPPHDLRVGVLGGLARVVDRWSEVTEAGGWRWHMPTGALLVMLLAARVGDAEALPLPPAWFHLATALLAWREDVDVDDVVALAETLEVADTTLRGLAIVGSLFPELRGLTAGRRLDMPLWERLLAVPVVARRVVRDTVAVEPDER